VELKSCCNVLIFIVLEVEFMLKLSLVRLFSFWFAMERTGELRARSNRRINRIGSNGLAHTFHTAIYEFLYISDSWRTDLGCLSSEKRP